MNGFSWRATVTRMGGEFLLGFSRDVRGQAGVEAGDTVELDLTYARWIAEAKREETRERRVAEALRMLREGETRS